ncbi:hypothetical protein L6452_14311 [Arctium lappa]|uniref:Uncharacterized protein n=1 Tax=Arctium lappa TaxID=4217 RepID=A0ACB9CL28_ARCLA|nr:hypothetical protein L6452_14311 [Arctium lappa]
MESTRGIIGLKHVAKQTGRAPQDTAASTTDEPRVTNNDLPPPLINALGGGPEHVPRRNLAATHPIMEEVTPETRMMDKMMQAMNAAMAQQQEMFMKLLEDRDTNNCRPETVAENVIVAGSGGSEPVIPTNETLTPEASQGYKPCTFKTFLGCRPPEFKGTDDPGDPNVVECLLLVGRGLSVGQTELVNLQKEIDGRVLQRMVLGSNGGRVPESEEREPVIERI